jgi:hypothetical protein
MSCDMTTWGDIAWNRVRHRFKIHEQIRTITGFSAGVQLGIIVEVVKDLLLPP